MAYKSTADIKVPEKLVDQVMGQESAVEIVKKAAQQRRHVFLIGEPGTGKCVGKESLIQLSDGSLASAGDLFARVNKGEEITALAVNPDLSLSHTRLQRAAKVRSEAFEFTTQMGKRIVVSAEHPFLSMSEKGVGWVFVKDLKQGAFVASCRRVEATEVPQRLPAFPTRYAPTGSHTNVKTVHFPEFFDAGFAEFCGYLWSEGYIARGRSIQFTNEEKELVDRFVMLAHQLFALDVHVRHFPEKGAFVATLQSSTVAHALRLLGWGHGIPDVLMKSPRPVIRSFLRAYFDGDGSMTNRGFEVTTKSARIAAQLQSLLLRFNIQAVHRRRMMRATNSTMALKEYRALVVYDSVNLARLAEVGFSLSRKQERFQTFVGKHAQSNIDKVPHIGKRLFELKEHLRLTAEDLDIEVHQFARYIKGTRIPTRATVEKIVARCAQRFVALKMIVPRMHVDGSIDVQQIWAETGISRALIARKIGISVYEMERLIESGDPRVVEVTQRVLATCISQDVEEQLIALVQIMDSDVTWERVKSITAVGTQDLYDFEAVGTHNFIADNLVVHNSMLGMALAELLPKEKLVDIVSFANPNDENQPLIRTVPAGQGRDLSAKARIQASNLFKGQNWVLFILVILAMIMPWWARTYYNSDIMFAAFFIGGMMFLIMFVLFISLGRKQGIMGARPEVPKVVVDNFGRKQSPFFDGTGAHAGALLGDVLHDPFQSGGLGTPAHERVVSGMIHKANMGVLFIDEIATLDPMAQQELLTALQEGKYPITGQSERSAGAMVRTEPVPCNFVLVAAGNVETVEKMHPALRSRIRGYGYEVFMKETMPDTPDNREKVAVFIAQEVVKDKKIPHFDKTAINAIVQEARRMANRKGHLTLRFRELGGLVRAAGDIAVEQKAELVTAKHVELAKRVARPLEQQIADKFIERKKEYEVIITEGMRVGRVNGLAVIGGAAVMSGLILPIEAEVTPGGKEREIVATGKLGEIAKEAIKNVSAIIKKHFGEDIKEKYDIYVQFLQTYEGVEGDSASIAVATAIISALKKVPVRQDIAMTGSLSVRGDVLPVGGVSAKVEAAIDVGIKTVLVPKSNLNDIVISEEKLRKVKLVPVDSILNVLEIALDWKGKEDVLAKMRKD